MLLLWDCGCQTARMMITLTPALGPGYKHGYLPSSLALVCRPKRTPGCLSCTGKLRDRKSERAPGDRDVSGGTMCCRYRCNMTESSVGIRVVADCKGNTRRPLLNLHDVYRSKWASALPVTRSKQILLCSLHRHLRPLQTFYSRRRPKRPYHCSRNLAIFLTSCLE